MICVKTRTIFTHYGDTTETAQSSAQAPSPTAAAHMEFTDRVLAYENQNLRETLRRAQAEAAFLGSGTGHHSATKIQAVVRKNNTVTLLAHRAAVRIQCYHRMKLGARLFHNTCHIVVADLRGKCKELERQLIETKEALRIADITRRAMLNDCFHVNAHNSNDHWWEAVRGRWSSAAEHARAAATRRGTAAPYFQYWWDPHFTREVGTTAITICPSAFLNSTCAPAKLPFISCCLCFARFKLVEHGHHRGMLLRPLCVSQNEVQLLLLILCCADPDTWCASFTHRRFCSASAALAFISASSCSSLAKRERRPATSSALAAPSSVGSGIALILRNNHTQIGRAHV